MAGQVPASWSQWAAGVLGGLGAAGVQVNLDTLAAWSRAESGDASQWMRWNNPLNTTRTGFGGVDMNSVGVKAYPTVQAGVLATLATLQNGSYPTIVDHLRSGTPAAQWQDACGELQTWGTGCAWISSPETARAAPQRSLAGQAVVGQTVTSPWFPGAWELTQGWGQTDYSGEPEGHGFQHWHAGVDVGLACGTLLTAPLGLSATARALDNPGGYGTALVLLLANGPAVLLGHLQARLVDDGAIVRGGDQLAITNNTGNSTGCHLHFEVRPQDPKRPLGMAAYGTDLDPSSMLLSGGSSDAQLLSASLNPAQGIGDAITGAVRGILQGAQVLGGALLVAGGLLFTAYGVRGQGPRDLQQDARAAMKRAQRTPGRPKQRPRRRTPIPARPTAAATRIRPDMQPPTPPPTPPA